MHNNIIIPSSTSIEDERIILDALYACPALINLSDEGIETLAKILYQMNEPEDE